jgi:tetratricopeptide (TPR) repeat protein
MAAGWTSLSPGGKLRAMPVRLSAASAALLILAPGSLACIPPPQATTEPAPAAAKAPTTAEDVLQRHVAALGGEPALRSQPQRSVEARVLFRDHPQCEDEAVRCVDGDLVGSLVLHATADGRLFRRMVVENTVNERGYDGTTGWTLQDGTVLELEGDVASLATREDALLHWYLDLAGRDIEPELLDAVDKGHDGTARVMDGLKWQASHGKLPDRTMWFDRETGLLREEVEDASSPDKKMVLIYDDYREVDGVMVAHSIRQMHWSGEESVEVDIVVQSATHGTVPEASFAVPTLEAPAPEADPILMALEQATADAKAAPRDARTQLVLARVAFAAGHFVEAKDAADRVLALVKTEPEAAFIAGRAKLLLGDLRGAHKALDRAFKTGLRPEVYALQVAWIFALQYDWDRASQALEGAGLADLAAMYSATGERAYRLKKTRACESTLAAFPEPETGRLAITATVEGTPARLMVDTGTRDFMLSDRFAGSILATRETDAPLGTSGPAVPHAYLESVGLGDFELLNAPTAIVPDAALDSIAAGVDGVIGVRPLMRFLVAIDGPGKELKLVLGDRRCRSKLAAERRGPQAPLYIHETHFVYTQATIGPGEGIVALNSGMTGADAALNSGAYARAGVGPPPIFDGVPTPAKVSPFRIGEIELPELEGVYGVFENEVTTDQFRIDGIVGMRALRDHRVVLDFPGRSLYARPSAADPAAASTKP